MNQPLIDGSVSERAKPVIPSQLIYRAAKVKGATYRVPVRRSPKRP